MALEHSPERQRTRSRIIHQTNMAMSRPFILALSVISICPVSSQTIGIMGGVHHSVWKQGGVTLNVRERLELGIFIPTQLHTNFVWRNEVTIALGAGGGRPTALDQVAFHSMLRFYPSPKFYTTAGLNIHVNCKPTAFIGTDGTRTGLRTMDLMPFIGVGIRMNEHSELGVRAGVGVLAGPSVQDGRKTIDHEISLFYSRVVRGKLPGFVKRRLWRRSFQPNVETAI